MHSATTSPRRGAFLALLALFFVSGACGLTYQVLWLRQLSLTFGVTVYAASTVLAAFMTGLGLGSWLAGRLAARVARPLRLFAVAEALIGAFAWLSPFALDGTAALYATLHRAFPESFWLLTATRFAASFAILLLPTAMMGVTLPLLSASRLVRDAHASARLGALYAVNTAGAVAGVLATGFSLIGGIGMGRTFLLAATLNTTVAALAWWLASAVAEDQPAELAALPDVAVDDAPVDDGLPQGALLTVLAVSGLASLALEIVWFRILVQFLPATTYAFSSMLATVLGGIAIGGAIAARLLATPRPWTAWLAALQLATGLAAAASLAWLARAHDAGWVDDRPFSASAVTILPAALLMGMSFPVALRLGTEQLRARGMSPAVISRRVGHLYAANVFGAIIGSLAGGFLVVPFLGVRRGLIVLAALYVASGALLCLAVRRRVPGLVIGVAGVAAFAVVAGRVPDPFAAAFARRHGTNMRELWRHEGAQTAVSVHGGRLRHTLFLDGLHQANDSPDMVRLHRTIGHLPMALHPDPKRALVIGLGGGATPGAVSQHTGAAVQVVELSEGVRQAARFFAHVNYDVVNQANVQVRVDDGRNFLLLTDQRYDVVTADIIQPIYAGAGLLYSREYFELVRRALAPGGLVLQWVGQRPENEYKLIVRTFQSVFPEMTLWLDGSLMIGSVGPLRVSREAFERQLAHPATREALQAVGLDSFDRLLSWYTTGPAVVRRFVGDGPVLTDDRPLIEYHRSLPGGEPVANIAALRGGDPREILAR